MHTVQPADTSAATVPTLPARLRAVLLSPAASGSADARPRSARWADRTLVALAIAAGVLAVGQPEADPDLWGHLRFGYDTLAASAPLRADPYSYVGGRVPWVNHEWLTEAVFAVVHRAAGSPGLALLPLAATSLIALILFRVARRAGLSIPGRLLWLAVLFTQIKPGLGTARPHLATYVAFLLLLLVLDRAGPADRGRLWLLPPLFAAWANLHGGVLAGAGLLVIWAATSVCRAGPSWRARLRTVGPPIAAALVATLANPYGWRLWWFLRTALVPRPEISEWQHLPIATGRGLAYVVVLAIGLFALVSRRREARLESWVMWLVCAALPLAAIRHTPLFGLATAVIVTPVLGSVLRDRLRPGSEPAVPSPAGWVPILIAAAALGLAAAAAPGLGCLAVRDPYPASAVRLLKQAGVVGNLATPFNWGEYVIWHLGPRIRVSVDGRRETVYAEKAYRRSLEFHWGTGDWDALLRDEPTDLALVVADGPADHLMSRYPGWSIVHRDAGHALYARESFAGLALLKAARRALGPSQGCFPGT